MTLVTKTGRERVLPSLVVCTTVCDYIIRTFIDERRYVTCLLNNISKSFLDTRFKQMRLKLVWVNARQNSSYHRYHLVHHYWRWRSSKPKLSVFCVYYRRNFTGRLLNDHVKQPSGEIATHYTPLIHRQTVWHLQLCRSAAVSLYFIWLIWYQRQGQC